MSPLLSIIGLVIGYDKPLNKPLSFEVCTGDVVLLRGDNGVGKTSLLFALANQVNIFEGAINRGSQLHFSMQSQQPIQIKNFPLLVDEYLALLGCQQSLPQRLHNIRRCAIADLSYGQMQLLSIWAMLNNNANLIILDEPTNHLDADARSIVYNWILNKDANKAILMISHDHFLLPLVNKVVEMTGV